MNKKAIVYCGNSYEGILDRSFLMEFREQMNVQEGYRTALCRNAPAEIPANQIPRADDNGGEPSVGNPVSGSVSAAPNITQPIPGVDKKGVSTTNASHEKKIPVKLAFGISCAALIIAFAGFGLAVKSAGDGKGKTDSAPSSQASAGASEPSSEQSSEAASSKNNHTETNSVTKSTDDVGIIGPVLPPINGIGSEFNTEEETPESTEPSENAPNENAAQIGNGENEIGSEEFTQSEMRDKMFRGRRRGLE